MKAAFIMLLALAASGAFGQSQAVKQTAGSRTGNRDKDSLLAINPLRVTEVRRGRITYSGIVVESANSKNPLRIFDPSKPENYTAGRGDIDWNAKTGKAVGWKLFSIKF